MTKTQDQWRSVLFTNESMFSLSNDYRSVLIQEKAASHHHPISHNMHTVVVWVGTFWGSTDFLMLSWDIVTAQWPAHEILDLCVMGSLPLHRDLTVDLCVMGNTFILKDDNAISHRIVRDSFKNI